MEIPEKSKKNLFKILSVLLVVLSIYFVVKTFGEIKRGGMLGQSSELATISFSGHGEVTAVPDIASIYFTISKDSATAKVAQDAVAVIEKKALDFLKAKGVEDKYIKTSNASFYPKYEYSRSVCPSIPPQAEVWGMDIKSSPSSPYYCPPSKQVITGYTASESITVEIKNIEDAGVIMQGLGVIGVSDLSGPNFAIDNEDSLKAEARKKAIDDAKEKAKVLAKDLGVRLVRITSFTESGNYYPVMYSAKDALSAEGRAEGSPASLPKGENTISSDVTITYEIR